jgi:hypothetical protein
MFEEGNLLLFRPFLFKNGATPKDKFFLVLKNLNGSLLLASLPTSKDHVPTDVKVEHGCIDISGRMFNAFVFLAGENVALKDDGTPFTFKKDTFIYGADLDMYPVGQFKLQEQTSQTTIERIGRLNDTVFKELISCLSKSKMVKNKYRRIL